MFSSVVVAVMGNTDCRDAVVLGAQLADGDGRIVVADLVDTPSAPLVGGHRASALRHERLHDGREAIYATLGPDPRVRYQLMAGISFADAATGVAVRERAEVVVLAQSALSRHGVGRLIAGAPCPVAMAPYGHRFRRAFAPSSIAAPSDDSAVGRRAAQLAQRVARAAGGQVVPCASRGRSMTEAGVDLVVIGAVRDEVLRNAPCPVLVVPVTATTRLASATGLSR